ncbi:hypothetical protein HDU93_002184 [Gonapodya sp. JEL0774]|nr:hypothetical protein HDU93_002184 [Gonapodya sp. JEL0774]
MLPIAEFFKLITSAREIIAADGSAQTRDGETAMVTGIPGAWKTTHILSHLSPLASPIGREDTPGSTSVIPDNWQTALVSHLDGAEPSQPADVAPARECIPDHTEHWQTAILPSSTGPRDPNSIEGEGALGHHSVNISTSAAQIAKDEAATTTTTQLAKIPDVWEIKESDLECSVSNILGKGGYSVVCRGKWLKDIDVAVKVITFAEGYDMKLLDIARGLEYLHSVGIVHADLSPDNVLVDRRKHAVLTDFGTSKVLSAATSEATGGRVGKARYMSPERLRGEGTTKADDIYAFAMVIYSVRSMAIIVGADPVTNICRSSWKLCTKKEPFSELLTLQFYAFLPKICGRPHERPHIPADANVPTELELLMRQCWDPDPTKRPPFTSITRILSQIT